MLQSLKRTSIITKALLNICLDVNGCAKHICIEFCASWTIISTIRTDLSLSLLWCASSYIDSKHALVWTPASITMPRLYFRRSIQIKVWEELDGKFAVHGGVFPRPWKSDKPGQVLVKPGVHMRSDGCHDSVQWECRSKIVTRRKYSFSKDTYWKY